MTRTQPETDHDLLLSMWIWMVGTNGDGLLGKFDNFVEAFNEWKAGVDMKLKDSWTHTDHNAYIKRTEDCEDTKADRRKINAREWTLVIATIIIPIVAIVLSHFWK
jgi:hypothetical protein